MKSKKWKKLSFFILTALVFLPCSLISNIVVSIPDTIIPRGAIYNIPIYGTIDKNDCQNINLTLKFNAYIIDIKGVSGDDLFAMKCGNPAVIYNYIDLKNAEVEISCNEIQNIENGIICTIDVEGLAGPDSLTLLKPEKILLDAEEPEEPLLKEGLIKIPGIPIIQQMPEGLGQNYPNPFSYQTLFPFYLDNQSIVEFRLFYTDGKMFFGDIIDKPSFRVLKISSTGIIDVVDPAIELEKGKYILEFTPEHNQPSGVYVLFMKVGVRLYQQSLLFIK